MLTPYPLLTVGAQCHLALALTATSVLSCLQTEVQNFQEECTRDLAAAEPIIAEAEAALNSLDKASLGELKSFGSPAAEVVQVSMICCTSMLGGTAGVHRGSC